MGKNTIVDESPTDSSLPRDGPLVPTPGGLALSADSVIISAGSVIGRPESTLEMSPIEAAERSGWRVFAILTALFLALFQGAIDATIIATALPVITRDLGSASGYTWIGGAYLLANAVSGPIWTQLSDIWGRKIMLLACTTLCFVSSAVAATAQTIRGLIIARAFQGMAGGGLILLVYICISDLFSLRKRSLYLGLIEFVWAAAGAIGPVLGGVFASLASWRWCFWINLPVCGVVFLLTLLFLDIKHEPTSFWVGIRAFDWAGLATFLGFSLMLLLGLNFGGSLFAWNSSQVIALIVVGSFMIVVFVYSEARFARYPLIPLTLFRDVSNVATLLLAFFHGMVFISGEYYLPLFFQSVSEASPLRSGVLVLPVVLATTFAGLFTGVVMHLTGRYRELMWAGTILMCLGRGLFVLYNPASSIGQIIGFQLLAGIGTGLLFAPPLVAVQARVSQADTATATSTLNFVRNMALTFSVVIGGVVFQNSMDARASFLQDAGLPAPLLEKLNGKNAAANVELASSITDMAQKLAVQETFSWALRNLWIMYTALGFVSVIASFFIMSAHLSQEHTETVTGIRESKD